MMLSISSKLRLAAAFRSSSTLLLRSGLKTQVGNDGERNIQAEAEASDDQLSASVKANLNEQTSTQLKVGITPRGFITKWKLRMEDIFKVSYGDGEVYHMTLAEKLGKKAKLTVGLKIEVFSDIRGLHYRIPLPGLNPAGTVFERFGRYVEVVNDADPDGSKVVATFKLPQPVDNFQVEDFEINWSHGLVTFTVKRYKNKVVVYGKGKGKDEEVEIKN